MELIFLGTSAGKPTKERNVSAIALSWLPERSAYWLFDCGEATQHQMLHYRINPVRVEKIFITHLHSDHLFGLPGLLNSRSMDNSQSPLTLYGPTGLSNYIHTCLTISHSYLTYPLEIIEISPGLLFDDQYVEVTATHLQHRVETFGYKIVSKSQPGKLDKARLAADNIQPGVLYQQLKKGETVHLPDGRVIDGRRYLGPNKPGKSVVIFGDTSPAEQAIDFVKGADVLVHEATLDASLAEKALLYGHSTTEQAARFAQQAEVSQLIITHFSSRYSLAASARLLDECRAIFPATEIAADGKLFKL